MSLECNTDKQDQDLMALLICGVRAAESTKVSFAPWNLFAGMGTSENQRTSNVVDGYVESDGVVIDVACTSALFRQGQTSSWS